MAFKDFFTIYQILEPPEIYENENSSNIDLDYLFKESKSNNPISDNIPEFSSYKDLYPGIEKPSDIDFNFETTIETPSSETRTLKVSHIRPAAEFKLSRSLINIDVEDLLKLEGITSVNGKALKFGSKTKRTSNIGSKNSHHREIDSNTGNANARDISIVGGTVKDYADFRTILLNNSTIRTYMLLKGWGIINEITPEILKESKGTGMHFHFGPDLWARKTWNAWLADSTVDITKNFRV